MPQPRCLCSVQHDSIDMVAPAGCTTASLTPLLYGDALKRFLQSALSTSNPNTITLENHLTPTGESQGHSEYLPPVLASQGPRQRAKPSDVRINIPIHVLLHRGRVFIVIMNHSTPHQARMLIPSHRTGQASREAQAGSIRTARCRPSSILHAST